jgi:periplasmic protein TonB
MSEFDEYREDWSTRWRGLAIPVAILAIVVSGIFYFLHDTAGIRREAPPIPVLTMLPPPPPPPQKPPEPEKKIEEAQKPVDQPKQQPMDAPKPMTMNAPAQAGTDAFNVGAGSGDGSVGSGGGGGFGEANYSRYLGSVLQQAIQNDDRVNRQVFTADMAVWVDADGRVTRAKVLKTSGDPKLDMDLVAALEALPTLDETPPSTLSFPQHIRIDGRRPA